MAVYFFDSSALVKRYVSETGTAWVNAIITAPGNDVHVAGIAGAEVVAALTRRSRSGLSPEDARAALQRFRAEYADVFYVVGITPQVIADAMALAETYALRGYDAVQLAAALRMGGSSALLNIPLIFVSADRDDGRPGG